MMAERIVDISGSKENLQGLLNAALEQLEGADDAALYVNGNGGPDLTLRFTADEDPENAEPLVEYEEL
jgi:hypothetical protein